MSTSTATTTISRSHSRADARQRTACRRARASAANQSLHEIVATINHLKRLVGRFRQEHPSGCQCAFCRLDALDQDGLDRMEDLLEEMAYIEASCPKLSSFLAGNCLPLPNDRDAA